MGGHITTYDVWQTMAQAEKERLAKGLAGIDFRLSNARGARKADSRRHFRVETMMQQIPWLLPSVKSVTLVEENEKRTFEPDISPYPFCDFFRAPAWAKDLVRNIKAELGDFVTVTIRHSEWQPKRDSSPATWQEVIDRCPLPVVLVYDTEALLMWKGKNVTAKYEYPAAAFDARIRMALYEDAKLNLMTSGGPLIAAFASPVPCEAYGLVVTDGPGTCTPAYLTQRGITDGMRVNNSYLYYGHGCEPDFILDRVKTRCAE